MAAQGKIQIQFLFRMQFERNIFSFASVLSFSCGDSMGFKGICSLSFNCENIFLRRLAEKQQMRVEISIGCGVLSFSRPCGCSDLQGTKLNSKKAQSYDGKRHSVHRRSNNDMKFSSTHSPKPTQLKLLPLLLVIIRN